MLRGGYGTWRGLAMNVRSVIANACCFPKLTGTTKRDVIEEMVNLLADAGKLSDPKAALGAILERERRMSTGMQAGIALPHGRTPGVTDAVAAFGLQKDGVDFASLDGRPAQIFVLTLSSPKDTDAQVQMLAAVGKLLGSAEVRNRLLQAETADDMRRTLQGAAETITA